MIILALALSASVIDGDTIRLGAEHVRLLAIDAPELPGHCRRGRACAPGNPYLASDSLRVAMQHGPIRIERVGFDRYGRTLAVVWSGRVNLSCWQLARGMAIYKPKWDDGGLIAAECER